MGRRVTKADLAEIVGRDERTLSRWQREGMPVVSVGLGRGNENEYDTEDVIGWLVQVASLNGKKESVRDRLDRLRADREEIALARDVGEVALVADMAAAYEAMITAAKVELLNTYPDALAASLSARYGIEVDESLIREPMEETLRKLAEYEPDDAPSDGDTDYALPEEGFEEDGD
ncbi:terminase small subunit [Pseudomonas aeruginosa]|uniref:terminase small subunit n=1 Tax=Pseudomonas aeruginosa TaxID=287 RepID=UPI0028A55627|nr:terminase small subunit [Pseudomonas aeruginosa]HCL4038639.1 terminase small subunit [Pseudomonas aeruginosa]HDY5049938.1 terminase small subunit [Pseudomonas aeruginosa]